jgi:hypothetical protein
MSDTEYLTTREFARWAEHLDRKLDEIARLREDTIQNTIDISVLQAAQAKSKNLNGGISATVAGVISGIAMWLSSR